MIILQRTVYTVFKKPRFNLKITKFAISWRGLRLWNKILDNNTDAFTLHLCSKNLQKVGW